MSNETSFAVREDVMRVVTVAPQGRLDMLRAIEFRKQMQELIDGGAKHLVLDLSETPFLDSAGMAALVSVLKQCRERGGDARMVWPQAEPVKRILSLTKFDRVFDMKMTAEEAIASF